MIAIVIIIGIGVAISAIIMHTTNNIQIASGVGSVSSLITAFVTRLILHDSYKKLEEKNKKYPPNPLLKLLNEQSIPTKDPLRTVGSLGHALKISNTNAVLWSKESPGFVTVSDSGDLVFHTKGDPIKSVSLEKPFFKIHLPSVSLKENYIVATSEEGHLCYWDLGVIDTTQKPSICVDAANQKLLEARKAHKKPISCLFQEYGCILSRSIGDFKEWTIDLNYTSPFRQILNSKEMPSISRDAMTGTKDCLIIGSKEGDLVRISKNSVTHKKHEKFEFTQFSHCSEDFCICLREKDFLYIKYDTLDVTSIPLSPESDKSELVVTPNSFYAVSKGVLLGYSLQKPDTQTLKIPLEKESSKWSLLCHEDLLLCGADDGSIFVISLKTRKLCKIHKNGDTLNRFAKVGGGICIFNKDTVTFASPQILSST